MGEVIKKRDGIRLIKRTYDGAGQVISCEYSNGRISPFTYDDEVRYRKSEGYKERYEYDENGNLIHYKDGNGYEEWYERDEKKNVIHFRNSNGNEWKEVRRDVFEEFFKEREKKKGRR